MTYQRTDWVDRIVSDPNRYDKQNETTNSVELIANPGTVVQAGTPLNAANMNNIEDGIEERATWEAMHGLQREVIELKLASTLKNQVDGATDLFYDDGGSGAFAYGGSSMELEKQWNTLKTAVGVGAQYNVPLLYKFQTKASGFSVGQEVTIQSLDSVTVFERRMVSAIDTVNNTITFSAPLTNTYPVGSLIYRSMVARAAGGSLKFATGYKFSQVDANQSAFTITYSKSTGAGGYAPGSNVSWYSIDAEVISDYRTSGTPALHIWKRLPDGNHDLVQTIPQTAFTGAAGLPDAQISPNGKFVAVPDAVTKQIVILKLSDDLKSYTIIANLDLTAYSTVYPQSMAWSSQNSFLSICCSSSTNRLNIWKITGDTFTYLSTGVAQPGQIISRINWSPDEKWISLLMTSNSPSYIAMYKQVNSVVTLSLTLPPAGTYSPGNCVFSPDSSQAVYSMAESVSSSWRRFYHYKMSGDVWTAYKTLGNSVFQSNPMFSLDGQYIYGFDNAGPAPAAKWTTFDTSTVQATGLPVITELNVPTTLYSGSTSDWWYTDPLCKPVASYRKGAFYTVTGGAIELRTSDIRYKAKFPLKVVRGFVVFVRRQTTNPVTVSAAVSANGVYESFVDVTGVTETLDSTTSLDTFPQDMEVNGDGATVRVTMARTSTAIVPQLISITGATE
jgi:hypothetical protein